MRDAGFEPDGHWKETTELTEYHLLACFSYYGLIEELGSLSRVEMCLEAPDSGLAESSDFLGEVECLVHGGEGIVVGTLGAGKGLVQHYVLSEMYTYVAPHGPPSRLESRVAWPDS